MSKAPELPPFDPEVLRAMARWPDVPRVYDWLRLDCRGSWRIRDEPILHARTVAFLARQNPLAIVFFAFLVGGISASGGLMQRRFDMPDAATQVLQGVIFLCVLASNTLYGRLRLFRERGVAA